jgi:hypothetical protein
MKTTGMVLSLAALVAFLSVGCSDLGDPVAADVGNGDGNGGGELTSFDNQILPIFEANRCFDCHSPTNAQAGLDLTSYESLMDEQAHDPVVIPYEPDNSTLVEVLENQQMPQGGPYLSPGEIDLIRQWILEGAQPDGGAY